MKLSRPVLYMLLATLAAAYFLLPSGSPTTTSSLARKKAKKISSRTTIQWTKEDLVANEPGNGFPLVNEPVRNAFKPLVARADRSAMVAAGWTGVPVEIAGEPTWIYTGMAEVDGVPTALLENTRTLDGVFLKQGQKWKGATVTQIKPEELVLLGPDGVFRTVRINNPEQPLAGQPGGAGFAPVNPPLRGAIGGGLAVRPDSSGSRQQQANSGSSQEAGVGAGHEN